jgi:predicted metal-dependent HD superfamily phosphohydrolase
LIQVYKQNLAESLTFVIIYRTGVAGLKTTRNIYPRRAGALNTRKQLVLRSSQREVIMVESDYEGAIAHALYLLTHELHPAFLYHDLAHTRDDVMPTVEKLAHLSGCEAEERALLRVAAAFHDLGLVETRNAHELAGMRMAAQLLPSFGFGARQIERVLGMILATRLPQAPRTPAEELLADADLDVLGRTDFLPRNQALRDELAFFGQLHSDEQWYGGQLAFLEQHVYFSAPARALRDAGKQANAEQLRALLTAARRPII